MLHRLRQPDSGGLRSNRGCEKRRPQDCSKDAARGSVFGISYRIFYRLLTPERSAIKNPKADRDAIWIRRANGIGLVTRNSAVGTQLRFDLI